MSKIRIIIMSMLLFVAGSSYGAEYVVNKFFGYMNFFHPEENFEQNSVELLFKELRNEKKFIHQNV